VVILVAASKLTRRFPICGHCAGAVTKAVETGVPGTKVEADPASKIVLVRGTSDLAAVRSLIAEAGYTPSAD
jgi:copper chaperone